MELAPSTPELMTLPQLWNAVPEPEKSNLFRVELHKRFALPASCLMFAFFGIALGVSNTRSGRSSGLFFGLVTTMSYYLLFLAGEKAARQGLIPLMLGIWGPNILLSSIGIWLFIDGPSKMNRWPIVIRFWQTWQTLTRPVQQWIQRHQAKRIDSARQVETEIPSSEKRLIHLRFGFLRLIDRMILREASRHFLVVLTGLCGVFLLFTLFDLMNSIIQNKSSLGTVFAYLFFLLPQILHYMLPFAILVAVLVTFGLYGKTSQLVALNSSGQSLYRLTVPVLVGSFLTGVVMFGGQEYVLPFTNRRQDYLRYQIKGGQLPPQTFYQTNRKWFYGADNRIFNFRLFNDERNEFVGLSIYEINPETSALTSRLYAKTATWDKQTQEWVISKGWKRVYSSNGQKSTRIEIREERLRIAEDPSYFKQEVPEISKMSIAQLSEQINDLQRSGLDTSSLRLALQSKIATPLACVVMAFVALPFAFSVGKRGALVGVSVGIAIAIIFWGTIGIFEQLGQYEALPPFLAAWGPNLLFSGGGLYLLLTART